MGEEDGIKSPDFEVHITADDEARSRCPEEFGRRSVLPLVLLDGAEEPSTAEGIAEGVDVSSCSTSVLEVLRAALRSDGGLYGSDGGVRGEQAEGLIEPACGELDVAVEQDDGLIVELGDGLVVARSEAVVFAEAEEVYLRVVLADEGDGVVCRAVVYDDEVYAFGCVLHPRGEEGLQEAMAVPVEDDDSHLSLCSGMHSVYSVVSCLSRSQGVLVVGCCARHWDNARGDASSACATRAKRQGRAGYSPPSVGRSVR